jgi:uncharacterized protein (DUF2236 family)
VASTQTSAFEAHRAAVRGRLARVGVHAAGPSSVSWKINREIIVVAGWGRAILLQFAHPLVAAGVSDHSSYRGGLISSFRRLTSTVGAMLSLTFGGEEEAIAAAAGINCIHDRIHGTLASAAGVFPAGQRYSAHDPELLTWVHATLLESVPLTYELLVGPLTQEERERYCAEAAIMEPLLDIPQGSLPRTVAENDRYMREMLGSGRIAITDTSRALARALLFPPRAYLLWPAFRALRVITIGLLPPPIRAHYGFAWRPGDARAFSRWTALLRTLQHAAPRLIREWPAARRQSPHRPPVSAAHQARRT